MSVVNERATAILPTHALVPLVSLLPLFPKRDRAFSTTRIDDTYDRHLPINAETKLVLSDKDPSNVEKRKKKRRETRLAGIGPRFIRVDRSAHSVLNDPPVSSRAANRRRFDFLR